MIHEIGPHGLDNAFRPLAAGQDDFAFFFRGGNCLLPAECGGGLVPRLKDYPPSAFVGAPFPEAEYLFSIRDGGGGGRESDRFFLLNPENPALLERALLGAGWKWFPPEVFRKHPARHLGFAGVTARHISAWRESAKFCGRCGARTVHSRTERAAVCPECSLVAYPSIMPAVIAAVYDGDSLLMAKSVRASYWRYVLIAGYVEIGETLEEAVRREVSEETGLKVKNIRYFGNQPWGFTCTQMVAFSAELDGSPEITLQESELREAAWIPREDIPLPPDFASIGGEMMRRFKERGAEGLLPR